MSRADFGDRGLAAKLLDSIHSCAARCGAVKIMEVCGTHTMEIGRLGLRSLLPGNVRLISGPGCPVCVTPGSAIDSAAYAATVLGATVISFGDMLRVPGSATSLAEAKAAGGDIRVATSPLHAVSLAEEQPSRTHVFVAVGFETTVPSVARAVELAAEKGLRNLTFLVCHRIVPPALDALVADRSIGISAFMLPGHVSAVIGARAYENLKTAGIPGAIAGFEPLDIIAGIHALLQLLCAQRVDIVNTYPRVVRPEGNRLARDLIERVFEPADAVWRGIGVIPRSGLALRPAFSRFDARRMLDMPQVADVMPPGCSCGEVLKGLIDPDACPLFGGACTPEHPVGPCMVSSEGSCAAFHSYER